MVVGYRKDLNAGQRPAVEYGVKAGSRSTSARCWWSRFRPVLIDNSARVGRAMQIACTPNIGLAGSLRHQRIIADRTKIICLQIFLLPWAVFGEAPRAVWSMASTAL